MLLSEIQSATPKKQDLLDIIGTNLLTMFNADRTVHLAPRVKNAPPLGSHVFQANIFIFELIQDIIETNLLTKFHEDWTINVASIEKCPAPGGHVFKATKTIFELIQDIIGTSLLTKFHDDRKINVTSRVLTMFYYANSHVKYQVNWSLRSQVINRKRTGLPTDRQTNIQQNNMPLFFEKGYTNFNTNTLTFNEALNSCDPIILYSSSLPIN
ncbi:hypothetical protein DPMN_161765 [Dreissena polymorpha]|uniref:Uncharacterized protein n=1 Tax=Dreissena polymorpha TaxID=45954 RepID=A0A9D4IRE1_DREPO|nr:hypothetical protein DPMN_161765 [Dreissena polymorpha]